MPQRCYHNNAYTLSEDGRVISVTAFQALQIGTDSPLHDKSGRRVYATYLDAYNAAIPVAQGAVAEFAQTSKPKAVGFAYVETDPDPREDIDHTIRQGKPILMTLKPNLETAVPDGQEYKSCCGTFRTWAQRNNLDFLQIDVESAEDIMSVAQHVKTRFGPDHFKYLHFATDEAVLSWHEFFVKIFADEASPYVDRIKKGLSDYTQSSVQGHVRRYDVPRLYYVCLDDFKRGQLDLKIRDFSDQEGVTTYDEDFFVLARSYVDVIFAKRQRGDTSLRLAMHDREKQTCGISTVLDSKLFKPSPVVQRDFGWHS